MFSAANIATVDRAASSNAYLNIRRRCSNAGYADSAYTILAQTYSSPIPNGSGFRYGETGFTRQTIGGCGVWNSDAELGQRHRRGHVQQHDPSNAVAQSGLTNVEAAGHAERARRPAAVREHGRAARGEGRGELAAAPARWTRPSGCEQIRTLTTLLPPYQMQEDGHPNYWGQLALRNCFRQAYNGGAPHGGTCTRGTGLDAQRRAEHDAG